MASPITPRSTDFSAWYNDLVAHADLAEHSPVRGCMVVRPYGWAVWEAIRDYFDARIKATGHVNASFPLFIPQSFLAKEADHIEGFAKECAVVTHYRLKTDPKHGVIVDPEAALEEPLIVRPTSETIIWHSFQQWIRSYRDLPLLINQWANVVRWEMRTRPFLRTTEFFWQEGHTAHASAEEADAEARTMLEEYRVLAEDIMAVPVIPGVKSPSERFAGATQTYTIEGLMQDGKALQMGTSHNLGQNFGRAFDVTYTDANGELQTPYATSWGVSTRLMGALIMVHSDDQGLRLPPRIAPVQLVVVPIITEKTASRLPEIHAIVEGLQQELPHLRVKIDDDMQQRPGYKFAEWELRGVPLRMAVGPRDLDESAVELTRRDTGEKLQVPVAELATRIPQLLEEIQQTLYAQAREYRDAMTRTADTWEEFQRVITEERGFVLAHWDGTAETEDAIKKATKATIRCIPFAGDAAPGVCVYSGQPSQRRVLFAQAY
ncbi:proline--tRNA ligase [Candidatus Peribacteria bacterium]|nr:proline--tRNA ligase [Candidatus Peribacteria bacterium]